MYGRRGSLLYTHISKTRDDEEGLGYLSPSLSLSLSLSLSHTLSPSSQIIQMYWSSTFEPSFFVRSKVMLHFSVLIQTWVNSRRIQWSSKTGISKGKLHNIMISLTLNLIYSLGSFSAARADPTVCSFSPNETHNYVVNECKVTILKPIIQRQWTLHNNRIISFEIWL